MRICRVKATKRIIEMQSDPTPGLLIQNALVAFGLKPDDVEELEVTPAEYEAAKAEDPIYISANQAVEAQAQAKAEAAGKIAALADEIPKAASIANLKVILLELVDQLKIVNT